MAKDGIGWQHVCANACIRANACNLHALAHLIVLQGQKLEGERWQMHGNLRDHAKLYKLTRY